MFLHKNSSEPFFTQDQYFMTEITFVRVVFRQYIIIIDKKYLQEKSITIPRIKCSPYNTK